MIEIAPGVNIGSKKDLRKAKGLSILSACQTIHYQKLGWTRRTVDPTSHLYLENRGEKFLTLNWVDAAAKYYTLGGPESFSNALTWISDNNPCLVHCDQGESRAPTLGLLYLAKRIGSIDDASFEAARHDFLKVYPNYRPGGISDYVSTNWALIH